MQSNNVESGHGPSTIVPSEVKRWNWGAFFLHWIWGVFNNTFIALLCLIPVVNLVMPFVLGFKGNEWAWRNKKWSSIEDFHQTQRNWAIAAICVWAAVIVFTGGTLGATFFGLKAMLTGCEPYKVGVKNAKSNPQIVQMLGDDIEEGMIPMGSVELKNSKGDAELEINLKGSKGEGTLFVEAVKEEGKWRFNKLKFNDKNSDKSVNLLESKALDE